LIAESPAVAEKTMSDFVVCHVRRPTRLIDDALPLLSRKRLTKAATRLALKCFTKK